MEKVKLYSRDAMFLWAGYAMGAKTRNPKADIGEVFEEFEKDFPNIGQVVENLEIE